ncbi:MAG: hypothetical protein WA839_03455 [Flavobacteriaceae bacterium]
MKNLIYPLIILLLFITQSCETDIPRTDTTPPQFTFRITGDGFEYVFNQDEDYSNRQLNLKNGTSYNFIYTGSDEGGVKLIQWQLPISDYIEFDSAIPDSWQDNVSGLSRIIKWNGDPNNPLTGNILPGTFEAKSVDDFTGAAFRFTVSDFGGESGSSNSVSKELTIFIGDHNTELIEL